ncbi:hypothetical protein CLV72_106213 [Allonocardiopsis opalescens]|uniref:Uncharacterized protein n=2 Tax=Allonocardiopsis opalescens TaxID=1144618 RepID=A0A2T0Q060_9ACTN|nr:hypothetical protein CLV72_106213 [Allonocardiopsis opalescens]
MSRARGSAALVLAGAVLTLAGLPLADAEAHAYRPEGMAWVAAGGWPLSAGEWAAGLAAVAALAAFPVLALALRRPRLTGYALVPGALVLLLVLLYLADLEYTPAYAAWRLGPGLYAQLAGAGCALAGAAWALAGPRRTAGVRI